MNKSFKETLFLEAKNQKILLDDDMLDKFEKYKDLLIEWNNKINLTAITDEYEIIMKHFIDCLEIVKYISEGESLVDVGTGAGFPGIVIAIYFKNNVKITLIDSINKRIEFLNDVIENLKLNNVVVINGRAEELSKKIDFREKFDICTSRAVAPLNILLEFDVPYIKVGGKCLLLKSNNIDEIKNADLAIKKLNCKLKDIYSYKYEIKGEVYNRYIVNIQKCKNIDIKYPRIYSKIKKNPL